MGGGLALIWAIRAAQAGIAWIIRNPQLALLWTLVALLAAFRIQSASLSSRLETMKSRNKALQADADAQERMNDADLGLGATDDDRIKRLREFADKHGG